MKYAILTKTLWEYHWKVVTNTKFYCVKSTYNNNTHILNLMEYQQCTWRNFVLREALLLHRNQMAAIGSIEAQQSHISCLIA